MLPVLVLLAIDNHRRANGEAPIFFGGPTLGDLADMGGKDWLMVFGIVLLSAALGLSIGHFAFGLPWPL